MIGKNKLPDDIFDLRDDQFYEFIEKAFGVDVAQLIRFQAIRNGEHLLETTSNDILLIFNQDSDDINKLKEMCCFYVTGNKFEIKLGVKLAINNLLKSLQMKRDEKVRKKRDLTRPRHSIVANIDKTVVDQTPSQIETASPTSSFNLSSNDSISPSQLQVLRIQKKSNEIAHKIDIQQRINKWWSDTNKKENLIVNEGSDYHLGINKTFNDKYVSVISCKCGVRFKLPFVDPGFFKLSTFYRHLREQQCLMSIRLESDKENGKLNNDDDSFADQENSTELAPNEQSHESLTSASTMSKRSRSQSTRKVPGARGSSDKRTKRQ